MPDREVMCACSATENGGRIVKNWESFVTLNMLLKQHCKIASFAFAYLALAVCNLVAVIQG